MSNTQLLQSMFKHLTLSYSADEAREILIQKYPDAEGDILLITEPETDVGVEASDVAETEVEKVGETEPDLLTAVKTKTAKPRTAKAAKAKYSTVKSAKAVKTPVAKGPSKVERARELYEAATDKSRKAIIALFGDKLNMSAAMASTYYYNIKK